MVGAAKVGTVVGVDVGGASSSSHKSPDCHNARVGIQAGGDLKMHGTSDQAGEESTVSLLAASLHDYLDGTEVIQAGTVEGDDVTVESGFWQLSHLGWGWFRFKVAADLAGLLSFLDGRTEMDNAILLANLVQDSFCTMVTTLSVIVVNEETGVRVSGIQQNWPPPGLVNL